MFELKWTNINQGPSFFLKYRTFILIKIIIKSIKEKKLILSLKMDI